MTQDVTSIGQRAAATFSPDRRRAGTERSPIRGNIGDAHTINDLTTAFSKRNFTEDDLDIHINDKFVVDTTENITSTENLSQNRRSELDGASSPSPYTNLNNAYNIIRSNQRKYDRMPQTAGGARKRNYSANPTPLTGGRIPVPGVKKQESSGDLDGLLSGNETDPNLTELLRTKKRATTAMGRNKFVDSSDKRDKNEEVAASNVNRSASSDLSKPTSLINAAGDGNKFVPSSSMDGYGQGAYAVVKAAIQKKTSKKVAVKVYEKYKLIDPQRKRGVRREVSILSKLDHENIIKLLEKIDTEKTLNLIMEFVEGISLHDYLKTKPSRKMSENEAKNLLRQITTALCHCHSKAIAHRDIKLENILIERKTMRVKLIDFGFSTCMPNEKKMKIFCGTPSYMAPEIVMKTEYTGPPADVWAVGVLMFTILTGHFPFKGFNDRDLYKKIMKGRFDVPDHLSYGARNLINKILRVDAKHRPTMHDILNDPWMVSTSESSLLFNRDGSQNGSSVIKMSENQAVGLKLATNANQYQAIDFGRPQGNIPFTSDKITGSDRRKDLPWYPEIAANITKLGYKTDEIKRQLKVPNSHIYLLYKRLLEDKTYFASLNLKKKNGNESEQKDDDTNYCKQDGTSATTDNNGKPENDKSGDGSENEGKTQG
eukprot:CAMPEP_0115001698 /NCGR_PEP_ID=MMETSP0216-20121206/17547_1 /TAXON_ID=223996 /ORGANISM="Protocruzia adherens, Strain Boccale" /LENGTH=655 /DNA_ID=CAMNT_0002367115 /DNA_START=618 /DNA_END=2586 /DNA_ORIENTATION=+